MLLKEWKFKQPYLTLRCQDTKKENVREWGEKLKRDNGSVSENQPQNYLIKNAHLLTMVAAFWLYGELMDCSGNIEIEGNVEGIYECLKELQRSRSIGFGKR